LLILVRLHSIRCKYFHYSFIEDFESNCDAFPYRVLFIEVVTTRHINILEPEELANRGAHFLIDQGGVQMKDTVALMMSNRFELVAFWLGVGKVGCSCALLNTNARGLTLEHALEVSTASSKSKLFVIERDLHDQLPPEQLATLAAQGTTVLVWEDLVSTVLSTMSPLRPSRSLRAGVTER